MNSIRDDAVFAWGLVGINQGYANYGHGHPGKGSQPADGLRRGSVPTGQGGPQNNSVNPQFPTIDDGVEPPRPPFASRASYELDRTTNPVGTSERMASVLDASYRANLGVSRGFVRPGPGFANHQHGLRGCIEGQGSPSNHGMVATPGDHYPSTQTRQLRSSTRQDRESGTVRGSPEVPTHHQDPHRMARNPHR
jgi:hypothetical protein